MSDSLETAGMAKSDVLLKGLDINVEDLLKHVEPVFGRPHAVLATGSLAAGLGNPSSDVDLVVIVPSEKVTKFPIVSHEQGRLIDAEYVSLPNQVRGCDALRRNHMSRDFMSAPALQSSYAQLWTLTRIAVGAEIHADEVAAAFIADLRSGWLAQVVAAFWSVEALRRMTAARWLCDVRPRTAAWRCGQAIFAAVDALTAIDGDFYCHTKWTSQKAARSANPGLKALIADARVRMIETDPKQVCDFVSSTRAQLGELLEGGRLGTLVGKAPMKAELRLGEDIIVRQLGQSTILTRFDLGGVEIRNSSLVLDPSRTTWSGSIDATPPPEVLELFRQHFLWLSAFRAKED